MSLSADGGYPNLSPSKNGETKALNFGTGQFFFPEAISETSIGGTYHIWGLCNDYGRGYTPISMASKMVQHVRIGTKSAQKVGFANIPYVPVGGWPTPLKNMSSSVGRLFPIYGKRKNVPNHQPVWKLEKHLFSWVNQRPSAPFLAFSRLQVAVALSSSSCPDGHLKRPRDHFLPLTWGKYENMMITYGKISETTWEHDDLIDLNVIKHEIVTPSSLFVYVFNLEPYVIIAQEKNGPATAISSISNSEKTKKTIIDKIWGWGGRVKWWFQERLRNHDISVNS